MGIIIELSKYNRSMLRIEQFMRFGESPQGTGLPNRIDR